MKLKDIKQKEQQENIATLMDCLKLTRTLSFKQKVEKAYETTWQFFEMTNNPVISCGGGKDGTAIALIAKMINNNARIICANPPNPLPDRGKHIEELKKFLGMQWVDIDYRWDVEAVLNGDIKYPEGLKMKVLSQWQKENNVDGVVFGIRASESRIRSINLATRGKIYKTLNGLRCQPIADWTAEESIALALMLDAPINPVYEKMQGVGDKEQLHDGTWWPHGLADRSGWIKKYYPDYYQKYLQAIRVYDGANSRICRY